MIKLKKWKLYIYIINRVIEMKSQKKELTFIILFSVMLVEIIFAFSCSIKNIFFIATLLVIVLLAFCTGLKIGRMKWD